MGIQTTLFYQITRCMKAYKITERQVPDLQVIQENHDDGAPSRVVLLIEQHVEHVEDGCLDIVSESFEGRPLFNYCFTLFRCCLFFLLH